MQVTITQDAASSIVSAGASMLSGGFALYALIIAIPLAFYIARKIKSLIPKQGPTKS